MRRFALHLAGFVFALLGVVLVGLSVTRWAPDAATRLPPRNEVLAQAAADSQALGYRVVGAPQTQISAGMRAYSSYGDMAVLVERVADPEIRDRLTQAVPPIRFGVRYWNAVSPGGLKGALLLEYDGDAKLIGATFGLDGILTESLAVESDRFVADRLARLLLGTDAKERREFSVTSRTEILYELGEYQPAAYVHLSDHGAWAALRLPVPYRVIEFQSVLPWQLPLPRQARFFILMIAVFISFGVLLWRLTQRRAGLSEGTPLLIALIVGVLPVARYFQGQTGLLFFIALAFVLPTVGLFLIWSACEAEMREVRPGSAEHWDRLFRRRPIKATGSSLLLGVAFGAGVSGVLASSGQVARWLGKGGYGGFLTLLPDYWLLSSPINWGLALAALTSFFIGMGGRLAGRPGAMVGAAISGCGWSYAVPVAPLSLNLAFSWVIAMALGWLLWHHGLLALATACVTALSLPTAWMAWQLTPTLLDTAILASAPIPLVALGLLFLKLAPEQAGSGDIVPTYVSDLDRETRLRAEVDLLRSFQLALLPPPQPANRVDIDVAWRMVPADVVGGDFLDVVEDEAGRLWLAIADVAGHGIACSMLTAYTKAAVAQHARAGVNPAEALTAIRNLFDRLQSRRTMVTLCLAVWDADSNELRVACAGHLPLLVLDGGRVQEVGSPASPLGSSLRGTEHESSLRCGKDAVIVAYSDGVVEASSPRGEMFGFQRWPAALPALAHLTADEILGKLLLDVDRHRDGVPATDDVSILVLKLAHPEPKEVP